MSGDRRRACTITLQDLKDRSACTSQVKIFEREFPSGVATVDKETALKVSHLFNWGWARRYFLSLPALKEYDEAREPARKEYDKVCDLARKEYDKVCALARKEYDEAREPVRKEYDKVCALAWKEYDKVCALAWKEYDKVCALAFVEAFLKEGS